MTALSLLSATAVLLVVGHAMPARATAWLMLLAFGCTRARVPTPLGPVLVEHVGLLVGLVSVVSRGRVVHLVKVLAALPGALWLWLTATAAASLLAPLPLESLKIVAWIVASIVAGAVVVALVRDVEVCVRLAVAASVVNAFIAVALWLLAQVSSSTLGVQQETLTGAPAAFGLHHEANLLGGYSAVHLLIAVLYRPFAGGWFRFSVGVLALAVVASLTRAAALAVGVGLALALFARLPSAIRRRSRSAVVVVVLAALVSLLASGVSEKMVRLLDVQSSTARVRLDDWAAAIDDMKGSALWIGRGANSYGQFHLDDTRPGEGLPAYLGNVVLQVVYDSGVIGLGFLAVAVAQVIRRARGAFRRRRRVALAAAAATIGIATSPLFFAWAWFPFVVGSQSFNRSRTDVRAVVATGR